MNSTKLNDWMQVIAMVGFFVSVALGCNANADDVSVRSVSRIADGIFVISDRAEPFEGGNTTLIVGEESAIVIDTTFYPYSAREDIAKIRELTDKPIGYVLNTHWHNDHVAGNAEYRKSFPECTIIAHHQTVRDMDLNIPNAAKRLLPGFEANEKKTEHEEPLDRRRRIVDDYRSIEYERPTLTFQESLNLDLGNREVRIDFIGRGNTNGDVIAYVPTEGVLVTGDLVVSPIPYVYDGYPTEWVVTLDRLFSYDAKFVVPGHGSVQTNWDYVKLIQKTMQSVIDQVDARLYVIGPAEFRTIDDIKDHVDLSEFRELFAGNSEELSNEFDDMTGRLIQLVFKEASLR